VRGAAFESVGEGQRLALASVWTRFRPLSATMMMAQPDVIKLTPTKSPSAQLAVFGQPSMISPARIRSAMPLASDDSARRIYLNFDKDWHRDFTVLIEHKDNETLRAAGVDTKALAGKSFVSGAGSKGGTAS
jgi:hypothetical protein